MIQRYHSTLKTGHDNKSMERSLLESMIQERDHKISCLQRERLIQDERIAKLQAALNELRVKHKEDTTWYRLELERVKNEKVLADAQLDLMMKEFDEKTTLHEYADIIKKASPAHIDSSYILRLQSQLCKAMHCMSVHEKQMIIVKENCDGVIQSLKEEIAELMEEKSNTEVELMNEISAMDNEKRTSDNFHQEKLEKKQALIDKLSKRIEELECRRGEKENRNHESYRKDEINSDSIGEDEGERKARIENISDKGPFIYPMKAKDEAKAKVKEEEAKEEKDKNLEHHPALKEDKEEPHVEEENIGEPKDNSDIDRNLGREKQDVDQPIKLSEIDTELSSIVSDVLGE